MTAFQQLLVLSLSRLWCLSACSFPKDKAGRKRTSPPRSQSHLRCPRATVPWCPSQSMVAAVTCSRRLPGQCVPLLSAEHLSASAPSSSCMNQWVFPCFVPEDSWIFQTSVPCNVLFSSALPISSIMKGSERRLQNETNAILPFFLPQFLVWRS